MKRGFFLIAALIIAVLLTGCSLEFLPSRIEIEELNMIRAIGLDKSNKDPNNIRITIVSKKREGRQGGKSGGQTEKEEAIVLSNEAPTILEAEREFQSYSDKQMFWGHVDYLLVGEEAAKDNIAKYIDFIARDHEFRSSLNIYIIKGSTAEEFIKQSSSGEYFMPDRLKAIGLNSKLFTGSQELELLEFMEGLNNKYSSAIAPVLYLKKREKERTGGVEPAMDIELNGYAIFNKLKFVTTIDRMQARGENFLLNRVVNGAIQVKDPSGAMIGLDIIESYTKITPVFEKGELQGMSVKVRLSSNVDEVHSALEIFTTDTLNILSKKQSNIVKSEIEQVIKTAKDNRADYVGMASAFDIKHPVLWQKYKDKWDEIFPDLPIHVEVESKINRTYDIRQPNGFFEEEHK